MEVEPDQIDQHAKLALKNMNLEHGKPTDHSVCHVGHDTSLHMSWDGTVLQQLMTQFNKISTYRSL